MFLRLILTVVFCCGSALVVFPQSADTSDPLVRVLQAKGILTDAEARSVTTNASPAEQRDRLATLLRDKGVISATEFEAIRGATASTEVKTITAEYKTSDVGVEIIVKDDKAGFHQGGTFCGIPARPMLSEGEFPGPWRAPIEEVGATALRKVIEGA